MPTSQELRAKFASFLGEERFKKFIRQGFKPRLKFWQEQEWQRFVTENPSYLVELPELELALRVCEVHGNELRTDRVEVFEGHLDYTAEFVRAQALLFPHAEIGPIPTNNFAPQKGKFAVWYCPECREAFAQWKRRA